ncbi:hypothetical protein GCM10010275_00230 [Streptomyces litmocidini]|nr:hypothetical protein GCM10010275_00230 [Streptomyces litmocidini]
MFALVVLALGVLPAVARTVRDLLIVRHVRAMLSDCAPSERVRVCLRLAGALGPGPSPSAGPESGSGQAAPQEVADQ